MVGGGKRGGLNGAGRRNEPLALSNETASLDLSRVSLANNGVRKVHQDQVTCTTKFISASPCGSQRIENISVSLVREPALRNIMASMVIRYPSELNDLKQDGFGQLLHLQSCRYLLVMAGMTSSDGYRDRS